MIGFPWLTEQVDDSTGIWRMAGYSQQFPNVYFLNYAEALLFSLIFVAFGRQIRNQSLLDSSQHSMPVMSRMGFVSTIISSAVLLYFWVRMTVLWCTYVLGNTVYYPATTSPPTVQWLQQFGLPLNINRQPYSGGLPFRVDTSTISVSAGLHFDAGLYIVATVFFFSVMLWKYSAYGVHTNEEESR